MKVPKHIKESIKRGYKASLIAQRESLKLRNWLDKNNVPDYFEDLIIDVVELSQDTPESLIEDLENI